MNHLRALRTLAFLGAALVSFCAHASSSTTYLFTFHNLLFAELPAGSPDRFDVSGSFSGVDANHDGALSLNELTSFTLGGSYPVGEQLQFLPSFETPYSSLTCIPEPSPEACRLWSNLASFHYTLGTNDLQASGYYPVDDDASLNFWMPNGSFVSGIASSTTHLNWMPDSWTTVRPIPEPPTAVLLLLGLAGGLRSRTGSIRAAGARGGHRASPGRRRLAKGQPSRMRSRVAVAAVASVLACVASHAAPNTTYQFTFHHLVYLGIPATDPNRFVDVSGVFTGSDENHDGTLSLGELVNFTLGTNINPVGGPYQMLPRVETPFSSLNCIPEPDPEVCRLWSHLISFSYTLGTNNLQASGGYPKGDDEGVFFSAPNGVVQEGIASSSTELGWTPDTWTRCARSPSRPRPCLPCWGWS
jgi:hypothetical protein